jgi:hypothetical protein
MRLSYEPNNGKNDVITRLTTRVERVLRHYSYSDSA